MTIDRETVIRLARDVWGVIAITEADAGRLERFAAMVLEHERKPLTDEQVRAEFKRIQHSDEPFLMDIYDFRRGVTFAEAAHGIPNKESSDAE